MNEHKPLFRQHLKVIRCSGPMQQILAVVAVEEAEYGKATTRAVALRVMLSESQVWRYLAQLEQAGRIRRVGQRGGWCLEASHSTLKDKPER